MSRTVFSNVLFGVYHKLDGLYDFEKLNEKAKAKGLDVEGILYQNGYSENEVIIGLEISSVFDGGFEEFNFIAEQKQLEIKHKVQGFAKEMNFNIETEEFKYYQTLCNI